MADSLDSMTWAVEEARVALQHARAEASKLKLPGTESEIGSALSRIESILFEVERKTEKEFARFRDDLIPPRHTNEA
ncbi:MAG TPA: hypothetical protein VK494_09450 [Gemmatimonadaceae bacterium]|nr:hypothetical protein [Gemmatimonadaceae bacterium]